MHGEGPFKDTDGRVQGTDGPLNGTILLRVLILIIHCGAARLRFSRRRSFCRFHAEALVLLSLRVLFSRTLTPVPVQPSRWLVALPKVP